MPKFFAVFLPAFAAIASTLSIVLVQKNSSKACSKKANSLLLAFGALLLLAGLALLANFYK